VSAVDVLPESALRRLCRASGFFLFSVGTRSVSLDRYSLEKSAGVIDLTSVLYLFSPLGVEEFGSSW